MERLERDASLPDEMQRRWTEFEDASSELIVNGGTIAYFGQLVAYNYKLVSRENSALTVSLQIDDEANVDTFQRANITELAITPEGDFLVANVKFSG